MNRTGLYFGSFNPIHTGHLILANAVLEHTDLDEVWFVVSPQSPFKQKEELLADQERLRMVQLAVEGNPRLQACDVELHLPTPSFTHTTLCHLAGQYPDREFALIMGGDNLEGFPRWYKAEEILEFYRLYVYPRPGYRENPLLEHPHVTLMEGLPLMEISSSHIRQEIAQGRSVRYLVSEPVRQYIIEKHFYKHQ